MFNTVVWANLYYNYAYNSLTHPVHAVYRIVRRIIGFGHQYTLNTMFDTF